MCNAKCQMCTVWQMKKGYEMPAHQYSKLPKTLNEINVTGGEPFLRKDLVEVIEAIYRNNKNVRFVFSSNGLLPDLIAEKTREILELGATTGIRISVDGIGEMHEKSRGIPGAFDKTMASVEKLKQIGLKDLGLAFTLADSNVGELEKVYDLATKELGIEFTFCGITHNSKILFGNNINKPLQNLEQIKYQTELLANKNLRSFDIKKWFRAYYNSGIFHHAKTGSRDVHCSAGTAFFYMHPNGDIFPDMVLDKKFGNLEELPFNEIWFGEEAEEFRKWIADVHNCSNQCWMVCTVAPWMRNNKFKLILWIIKNKLNSHLGKFKVSE